MEGIEGYREEGMEVDNGGDKGRDGRIRDGSEI